MRDRYLVYLMMVAALLLSAIAIAAPITGTPPRVSATETSQTAALPANRDTELYRSVIARVQAGESYYAAASELHRERSYPLYPFFTVRPPALAYVSAWAGSTGLYLAAWFLLAASILVWLRTLSRCSLATRAAAAGLLAMGGAATITPAGIVLHEFWCGLLLTIALGFMRDDQWPMRLAFAALALLVREFAVMFVLAIGFLALLRRRWWEFAATAGVAAVFAALMTAHYFAVIEMRVPSDLQSPAWTGLRGPAALVRDLSRVSWVGLFPYPVAAILTFLPLAGWAALRRPWLPLLWFGGFGAAIAIFARPNNEYWILALLPAYPVGLALLGKAAQLAWPGSMRRRLEKFSQPL